MNMEEELDEYPHPLKESNPYNLFNIVSGQVAGPYVNVHNALSLGACMVANFRAPFLLDLF